MTDVDEASYLILQQVCRQVEGLQEDPRVSFEMLISPYTRSVFSELIDWRMRVIIEKAKRISELHGGVDMLLAGMATSQEEVLAMSAWMDGYFCGVSTAVEGAIE